MGAVVVAEGKGLDLGIKGVAHVIGDAMGRSGSQRPLGELKEGTQDREADHGQRHPQHHGSVSLDDALVDDLLGHARYDQHRRRGHQQADEHPQSQ